MENKKECPSCNKFVDEDVLFCPRCGHSFKEQNELTVVDANSDSSANQEGSDSSQEQKPNDDEPIKCPNCGSTQVEFVTYQASSNFDAGDACCGWMLCGPIGLLFGQKEKTPAKTVRKCKKCGHEF